jgi:hypothetical protein
MADSHSDQMKSENPWWTTVGGTENGEAAGGGGERHLVLGLRGTHGRFKNKTLHAGRW